MYTNEPNVGITKQQIRAMKNADYIVFDKYEDDYGVTVSQIRAGIEAGHSQTGYEQIVKIPTTFRTDFYTLSKNRKCLDRKSFRAFASLSFTSRDLLWQTIVGLLRPGDELRVIWIGDNNSQYHDEADLHHDECRMRVMRDGREKYEFQISHGVCKDNSARMIQSYYR